MATLYLGIDAKSYYGTAGAQATTELDIAKDVGISMTTAVADITTREAQGWQNEVPTLSSAEVTMQLRYDESNAAIAAIRTAFLSRTPLAFWFRASATGEGLDADFTITNFSTPQNHTDSVMVDITLKVYTLNRIPTIS